ncbi:uncharacterized protein IUM83_12269 [Phytophthora cinnamomi]|uniref:uncharacterized protein n=1 Tax=Phytophthora cinnamomi TaxID=4785 RepID=UPI00355A60B4|nr:hypothetical protein IUM83_12269 [Phytophthora cinnamomi]
MSSFFDESQPTVPLLMMCGYRSKVCTNFRATKIDGTLHRLCEFHRRRANVSQQRLHQRHREERLKRKFCEEEADADGIHVTKKV